MEENEYGPGVNSTRDLVIKVLTHLRYIDKDLEKFKEELAKKADKESVEEILHESRIFRDRVEKFITEQITIYEVKEKIKSYNKDKEEKDDKALERKLTKIDIIYTAGGIILAGGALWNWIVQPLLDFYRNLGVTP
jgi:hypothetical protein